MAKKKESMSVEDRLAAALVPEEEWPYEIPENWVWTTMQTIAKWGSGGTPSRKNPGFYGGSVPWIKTGELTDDYIFETEETITEEGVKSSSAKWFPAHTIIIAMYGATIGKTGIMGIPSTTNQACACGIATSSVDYKYLFYYARSEKTALLKKSKGGAQPNISQDIIKTHCFPLPPLPEQHRIVNQIESSFVKLDEIAEEAQAVIDGYENRKAAILHKAFTGELTEEWRKCHPDAIIRSVTITSVCQSLKYGTAKKSQQKGSVAVIRMGNLQNGEIDWTNLVYSDDPEDNEKYNLEPGDVLFNRTNSADLVGKTSIYRGEQPAIYAGYIIKLDYDHSVLIGDYLNYILNSPEAKEYCNIVKTDGVNQSNINAKKIGAFNIPLRGMEEQHEIVRRLDTLLAAEATTKTAAEATLENITTLRQSILARAFRGELGTNDPEDEPAIELLKRTLLAN